MAGARGERRTAASGSMLRSLGRGAAGGDGTGPGPASRSVDLAPASAYEALTRQMVERLVVDLAEIKVRLDGLLFMVAGAIVLDVVLRVAALR